MKAPNILIVDDDSAHRAMLRTVLRGWGYAVEEAEDGDVAVEMVKRRAYDAILSDVRMARVDGISALRPCALAHSTIWPSLLILTCCARRLSAPWGTPGSRRKATNRPVLTQARMRVSWAAARA